MSLLWALLLANGARGIVPEEDWLVGRRASASHLTELKDGSLLLSNGLISRRFVTSPNWATVSLQSVTPMVGATEVLRGLSPEAPWGASFESFFDEDMLTSRGSSRRVGGRNKEPFYPTQRVGKHGHVKSTKCCVVVKLTINFEGSNRPNHDHGRQRLRHVVRARAEYMLMPTEYYRTSVPGRHKSMYSEELLVGARSSSTHIM